MAAGIVGFRLAAAAGTTNAEFLQNVFHQAPLGDAGLKEVRADKCGEPEPVRTDPVSQREAEQDKTARNNANVTFDGHLFAPLDLVTGTQRATDQTAQQHTIDRRNPRITAQRAGAGGAADEFVVGEPRHRSDSNTDCNAHFIFSSYLLLSRQIAKGYRQIHFVRALDKHRL